MEKKIPIKNYFIVVLLIILTVSLTFYLMMTYNNKDNKSLSFVSQVKENELDSYITERQEVIIYMSSSNNKDTKGFENELKKYTEDKNLKDLYVYLDLNDVSSNFYNEFYVKYLNESYTGTFEIKEPTIVIIRNGKIDSYLNNINDVDQVKEFFEKNEVLE